MSAKTSSEKLKKALQEMPETGVLGFEGLVKRLLELILKEAFVLARSGDQPSGDAHNISRNVCVQAKRYTEVSPNAKNIEGDFDENLRTLLNTDIYVLAVTRETAQLNDTIEAMREKSAVDVVVWDFGAEDSALPALCVEYWGQLQDFPALSTLNAELHGWASAMQIVAPHNDRIARLQSALRDCTQSLSTVRLAALAYLTRRFQLSPGSEAMPLQQVLLSTAVPRKRYCEQTLSWWSKPEARMLVMNAPEGYGKTWVAAQCALEVIQQGENIVLWLDSIQWRDCCSIEAVLTEAVSRIIIGDAQKVARLVRKLNVRWSKRTLVVLDGVSERDALPAAQRILEDLWVRNPGNTRFLFTTRPLNSARGVDTVLWKRCVQIDVEPFDEKELIAALAQAGIPVDELTEQLRPIARVPRYFTSCVRLRTRLQQFHNISVALVIWTDLIDKIGGLEPAIRQELGFSGEQDAIEVLVRLATSLPAAVQKGTAQELLNDCFGGRYAEVRNYLKEIRIMEKAGVFEATMTREHTILGRALFLQQVLRSLHEVDVRDAADRLLEKLEPLTGEDGGAEALFVALQLTAIEDSSGNPYFTQQRAVLLYAWVLSHNSNASDGRLSFWCYHDTNAYARFLEAVFEQLYSGNAQEFVVYPLVRLWRDGGQGATVLEAHLRKWLLLVWFEGGSEDHLEHKGHTLPIAKTQNQVRLASLAISFLSIRKDIRFIPDLALCIATESLTWRRVQELQDRFKSVYENIGVLMRWHYTERVLPDLEQLATKNQSDELILHGLRWLARLLKIAGLPTVLKLPPPEPTSSYLARPAVELIRQGRRVFGVSQGQPNPSEINFGYLAIRDDLPRLAEEDIDSIHSAIEALKRNDVLQAHGGCTLEYIHLEAAWPWFAKFYPMETAEVAGDLQLTALRCDEPNKSHLTFGFLAGVLPKLTERQLLEWQELANAKASSIKAFNRKLENYDGLAITETALLLLPEEAVHCWFLDSARHEGRRFCMFFSPMMELIPLTIPPVTRRLAMEKCLAFDALSFGPVDEPPTEREYWCYICGLTTAPDERVYAWAKRQLLSQAGSADQNFSLTRLWLRSAPKGKLESDLRDGTVAKLFNKQALRAWAIGGELPFDTTQLDGSYDELMSTLPQGFVGGVLSMNHRKDDLNRWGQELFAVAIKQLGKPPFERRSRIETQLRLDANRMIRSVGFESPPSETHAWSSTAGSWGVDYGSFGGMLSDRQKRQELLDDELKRWQMDESDIQKWEHYELHTFGAWPALEIWSKWYPDEFLPRAGAVLDAAIGNPKLEWHLGGFLHAVICCLIPTSPWAAWAYFDALNQGRLCLSVQSDYNVPEFLSILWDHERCNSPQHRELRRHLFVQCRNEFEVMVGCVAALANNSELELFQLADEMEKKEVARERALGISVLAWVGTKESVDTLSRVSRADPSLWVREHAEWATEVSLQESSARTFFRRLLHESDPYKVSAGLQMLKPSLTPLARWWSASIVKEEKRNGLALTSKAAAVIESFWHHFRCTHTGHVGVAGRRLDEFCRGEKLDQLRMSKLAPWWEFN